MSVTVGPASRDVKAKRQVSRSTARAIAVPLVLTFCAVLIMMYPVVVTQLKNLEQKAAAGSYEKSIDEGNKADLEAAFAAAQDYNKDRAVGPILDPWLSRISADNAEYQHYLKHLNDYDVMARLVVPDIKVDLPIYHGTGEDSLQRGVGHLYGSDLPVGGPGSHSVLTAHSGLRNATLFDNLGELEVGDAIYVGVSGERLKYQVYDTEVVLPHETESLQQVSGEDLMTLITCTPYGVNTHRLLVHAERVPMDAEEGATVFDEPIGLNWQWWMFALMAASLALMIGMAFWARKQHRAAQAKNSQNSSGITEEAKTPGGEEG